MDIPDLLEANDLTHRGGTYTVGFTQRREVQLFREFIAANPNSELRYRRNDRQHLRGEKAKYHIWISGSEGYSHISTI